MSTKESVGEWFVEELFPRVAKNRDRFLIFGLTVFVLNIVVWADIFSVVFSQSDLKIDFLDVGQGDSEFVFLPREGDGRSVKILIDGGPPNGQLLESLAEILPPTDRYIDLVILSHPQLDHFGGLIEVLKRYRVGAFISNGEVGTVAAYEDLQNIISVNHIPKVVLGGGDRILYQSSYFSVLLPNKETLGSSDINDTALVLELVSRNVKALFTGDISAKIESGLLKFFREPVDILKVAHHGSKYSSSAEFLNVLRPKLAVIEVGKNTYGHPTPEVLSRLQEIGAGIFRTDRNGNVQLVENGRKIKVLEENYD